MSLRVKAAFCCGVAAIAIAAGIPAQAQAKNFDIPAEEANKAIPEFGRQAGIQIVAPGDHLRGVRTSAVNGALETDVALTALLHGTGLEVAANDGGVVTLRTAASPNGEGADTQAAPTLETVTVSGVRGFGTTVTQIGSFRGAQLVDTPATIQVIPKDLLDAQQSQNLFDVLKNISGVTTQQTGVVVTSNQAIRGISISANNGFRMDGSLAFLNSLELPIEDKERVEVLKGASGLYYGYATPAGVINVTLKRPTSDQIFDVKAFGNSFGALGGAVDIGNTIYDGKFGYRVNAVYANENPGISHTVATRSLLTGTFDYHPIESVVMQLDVEHVFKSQPEPAIFRYVTLPVTPTLANPYPTFALPNVKQLNPQTNYAPNWAQYRAEEINVLSHNTWNFLDTWQLTVDFGDSKFSRTRDFTTLQPTNLLTGAGTEQFQFSAATNENKSGRFEVSGAFDTFGLTHTVTTGWQDNIRDTYSINNTSNACAGGVYVTNTDTHAGCQKGITSVAGVAVNYLNPTFVNLMAKQTPVPITGPTDRQDDSAFYILDRISWRGYIELQGGGRFGNYNDITINPGHALVSHAVTQSTADSVVVKPFASNDLAFYASYIEGLEPGPGAQQTAVNAGVFLAPLSSVQKEVGVKSQYFDGLLLTADWFDIKRTNAYINAANVFVEDGVSKYDGFEFNASGNITDELSLTASAMILMAKAQSGAATCGPGTALGTLGGSCTKFTPSIVGLQNSNSAKFYSSMFAQYKLGTLLPSLEGLAINGGAYYVGNRPIDSTNSAFLGSYLTYDLGASYSTDAFQYPMTFRVTAHNIGHLRYWVAGDSDLLAQGAPSDVQFSVEAHL
jgi:iron complex outermembrane receptor protein